MPGAPGAIDHRTEVVVDHRSGLLTVPSSFLAERATPGVVTTAAPRTAIRHFLASIAGFVRARLAGPGAVAHRSTLQSLLERHHVTTEVLCDALDGHQAHDREQHERRRHRTHPDRTEARCHPPGPTWSDVTYSCSRPSVPPLGSPNLPGQFRSVSGPTSYAMATSLKGPLSEMSAATQWTAECVAPESGLARGAAH